MGNFVTKTINAAFPNRKVFILDTGITDLPQITDTTSIMPGSEAITLDGSKKWVLDSNYTWVIPNADGEAVGGIEEAPLDGIQYGRQNGSWSPIENNESIEIVASLTSTDNTAALAASQGKILSDKLVAANADLHDLQQDLATATDPNTIQQQIAESIAENLEVGPFVEDISYQQNTRTLSANKNLGAPASSVILPQASDTVDGLMTNADRQIITAMQSDISSLKEGGVWRQEFATYADLISTFPALDVSATNWFINDYVEVVADETPTGGIHVQGTMTIYRVEVNGATKTLVYQRDYSSDNITNVAMATNSTLGIVKGATNDGKISIEGDGSMLMNGYAAQQARIQTIANLLGQGAFDLATAYTQGLVQLSNENMEVGGDANGHLIVNGLNTALTAQTLLPQATAFTPGLIKLSDQPGYLGGDANGHLVINNYEPPILGTSSITPQDVVDGILPFTPIEMFGVDYPEPENGENYWIILTKGLYFINVTFQISYKLPAIPPELFAVFEIKRNGELIRQQAITGSDLVVDQSYITSSTNWSLIHTDLLEVGDIITFGFQTNGFSNMHLETGRNRSNITIWR